MSRVQGRMKQIAKYTSSRYITHFKTATSWVEHGRIHVVNEKSGEHRSWGWQEWATRAYELYVNSKQMRFIYPDQAAQLQSAAEKMVQLAKLASRQTQPPVMTASQASHIRGNHELFIPGRSSSPSKLLHQQQARQPKQKQLILPDGYANEYTAHSC